MSSIEQKNGRWKARYRDLNGRSRSKTFDRKVDASRFLAEVTTNLARGEWIDPAAQRQTFDVWADRWWSTTGRLSPTTRRGYYGVLERHVRPHFSGRKLAQIDFMDVEEFIADRLSAGLSPKYVRQCVSVLSLICKSAVRARVLRENPAADHRVPVRRRKLRQGDVLDMAQLESLVEATPDRYKGAMWLLIFTGLRPAELCGLRIRDVDLTVAQVHVRQTILPVHKFDSTPFALVTGPTKTEAGNRTIPIPQWLCDDLGAALADRLETQDSLDPDAPLFQTVYGNPLNRDKFREKIVRPALRRAGLSDTLRTYDLRHSHVSMLIAQGADVLAIAQRMGHSDPAVTLREYGHLFDGVQERLTAQLDELRLAPK